MVSGKSDGESIRVESQLEDDSNKSMTRSQSAPLHRLELQVIYNTEFWLQNYSIYKRNSNKM